LHAIKDHRTENAAENVLVTHHTARQPENYEHGEVDGEVGRSRGFNKSCSRHAAQKSVKRCQAEKIEK
jgi:hypothetical protein